MKVKDFEWEKASQERGGIIPYFVNKEKYYFLLPLDNYFGMLTDFGGHPEGEETLLEGILREFDEETYGVLGKINKKKLQDCDILIGNESIEILYPMDLDEISSLKIIKDFREKSEKDPKAEARNIIILNLIQIKLFVSKRNINFKGTKPFLIYNRLQQTLESNLNFLDGKYK